MESKVQFTDGKINLRGNLTSRQTPKKADYILYINANNPIAIVEAKDNKHTISHGLQQAMHKISAWAKNQEGEKYPKKYYIYQAESAQVWDKEIDEETLYRHQFGDFLDMLKEE